MLKYLTPLVSTQFNREFIILNIISAIVTVAWWLTTATYFPEMAPIPAEIIGTFFTFTCVALVVKENLWCWPYGILGVIFLGYAFYVYGLYSTAILHLFYFLPIQFHGWWAWMQGEKDSRPLSMFKPTAFALIVVGAILLPAWGWSLIVPDVAIYLGESAPVFPFWDSLILWLSITAQILMNIKKVESWILWITVDIVAVILYAASGMWMVSALYGVFLIIATLGLIEWWRNYNRGQVVEYV